MYKFTRHFFSLENGEYIIIGNRYRGTYLKLSDECYQILKKLIHYQERIEDFYDVFESRERFHVFFMILRDALLYYIVQIYKPYIFFTILH